MTVWTLQESESSVADWERGFRISTIAKRVGRTPSAVSSHLNRLGKYRVTPYKHWPETKQQRCLEIWERGASYSIIAREIGTSRSAVAGFLRRQQKRRAIPIEQLPPYRGGVPPKRNLSSRHRIRNTQIEIPFDPARPRSSLADRLPDGCTFPFGDGVPYSYCNQKCVTDTPFCAAHCKIAYQPPRAR